MSQSEVERFAGAVRADKALQDELKKAANELGEKQKAIKEKATENHKKGEKS